MALTSGNIAFVGFNADGNDDFAFVAIVDINIGEIITFEDNEWDGSAFNTGEGGFTWTANSLVTAGTIVRISSTSSVASKSASTGILSSGTIALSNSDESIYAYQGSAASPTFITAISSNAFSNASTGTLTGTGLTAGLNALALSGSIDVAAYNGSSSGQANFASYLPLINNPANWQTQDGTGDQSTDSTAPDVPFSSTEFTIAAATPTVAIAAPDGNAAEAGSDPGNFRISRTGSTTNALTVNYSVATGSGQATEADYTPTLTGTATIAAGQSFVDITITPVDDPTNEGNETVTLTLNSSVNYTLGTPTATVAIADNDSSASPSVNLSVGSNTGTEAGTTVITVTATASSAVSNNQTVSLGVSGTGITTSDYYLSNTTITIPNGQTSGTVTFIVADDAVVEGTETATLTISNPSAGIILGSTTFENITITNNNSSFLLKVGGFSSTNGAEISAFDSGTDRLFVVAGSIIEIYNVSNTGALTLTSSLTTGFTLAAGTAAIPNSVAVKNGIVAVAYAIQNTTTNAQQTGRVSFYNALSDAFLNSVAVGALPDMLTFTSDGTKVLVANEGEPNSYGQANSVDPEGSVSIIDVSGGVLTATVAQVSFTSFNSQIATLKAAGVRITGPGSTVAQDLEPEYIAISPDGLTARITLQENNAIAILDIASATITQILPLGTKNHNLAGNGFDASDRDVNGTTAGGGKINIQNWPVFGLFQPDAIASFTANGQTYYITANEGDSRNYPGFNEEIRVSADGYVLDPTIFPNAATLKNNPNLGRLQLTKATGDIDGDGDFDRIEAFGARSFSIWDVSGNQIFDSGDQLEQITATKVPTLFNSDGLAATFDSRSDNKGPEPEGVAIAVINNRTYAFIGLERTGDVIVYEVTNPNKPTFIQYINTPEDVAIEGITFVSAADSPTGKPLLITANEISKTVAVFEVATSVRISDIQGTAHISPLNGQTVSNVAGIVTAVDARGFYLQDPTSDSDDRTSEAIFVFTSSAPTVSVGSSVLVSGTVTEFRPGGNVDNLTKTQITAPTIATVSTGIALPIATILGNGGRTIPTTVISNDAVSGNVENPGTFFDPAQDGIDFYESLEGMLVQVNNPVATSPTSSFGEIWVLADNGANATGRTARGGILVSSNDFNPERIQIDDTLFTSGSSPQVNVGATLSTITGVVDYNFNNYEVLPTSVTVTSNTLSREVTALNPTTNQLTVATFNVENLDPGDVATKFNNLASLIVTNLKSPDIINLEEIQDNNGATNDSVVDASVTYNRLIAAIAAAGGPTYEFRQINPVDDTNGGEPGGNIRVGFFFNPARVSFVDRPGGTSTSSTTVTDVAGVPTLSDSPGLINPTNPVFNNSRKPLVGEFIFNGETVYIVGNHFNSKGGDDPLFGVNQPPILSSEVQRQQQATIVKNFVDSILAIDPNANVIVAGDLNDFEFSNPLTTLESAGLTSLIETLPANERYTYNFEGNAQTLDHILASSNLVRLLDGYDVVHVNSEFADQDSDHDPSVARFNLSGNEAPTDLSLGVTTVDENVLANTVIGTFSSSDPDANNTFTYSLLTGIGDTDNAAFTINGDKLQINSSPNFDIKSSYSIRVKTTDQSGLSFEKALNIGVNNIVIPAQLTKGSDDIFNLKGDNGKGTLKIAIASSTPNANQLSELGVFNVDDAAGTVKDDAGKSLLPGANGYAKAALARAKVLFSTIANLPNGFSNNDVVRSLQLDSGSSLRFYLVQGTTTQTLINKNSYGEVVFSSTQNIKDLGNNGFSINFPNLVVNIQPTNESLDSGLSNQFGQQGSTKGEMLYVNEQVNATFTVNREAAYDNFIGFYQVTDESGIINVNNTIYQPGDSGYTQAAINSRVVGLTGTNQVTVTSNGKFGANAIFAPFMIANGDPSTYISRGNSVYFSFLGANPSSDKQVDHIRLLGNNTFGFEDLASGGDQDFNDLIVRVKLS